MNPLLVSVALVVNEGRVLVTQRPQGSDFVGYWEFPGGKVESGEDPRHAAERECLEECGIRVRAGDVVEVIFHRYPSKEVLLLFYRCALMSSSANVQHLGVSDHRWCLPAELDSLAMPDANLPLITKLGGLPQSWW